MQDLGHCAVWMSLYRLSSQWSVRLSTLWFWLDSCLYEVFGEKFQERGWEMREGALYGVLFLAGLQRVALCTSRCLVGSPSPSLGHEEWRALVSQPDMVL